MLYYETRDKYVSRSFKNLCPVFLMQAAADPGQPNKHSCTPHPQRVDLYILNRR